MTTLITAEDAYNLSEIQMDKIVDYFINRIDIAIKNVVNSGGSGILWWLHSTTIKIDDTDIDIFIKFMICNNEYSRYYSKHSGYCCKKSKILLKIIDILKEKKYTVYVDYNYHGRYYLHISFDKTINNNEVYNSCNKPGIISRLFGKRHNYTTIKID